MQDTCRDPAITTAYAKDPLCTQKGTFKGVADMLLGVSFLVSFRSLWRRKLTPSPSCSGRVSHDVGLQ